MAVTLARLPKYLVLDPVSTVRIEVELERPSCEIDVELENPKPGRSFLLLIGQQGGPLVQRMRLSGRARILFEPKVDGSHVLMLANPQKEPLVLRLRGRNLARRRRAARTAPRGTRARHAARRRSRVAAGRVRPSAPRHLASRPGAIRRAREAGVDVERSPPKG